MRYQWNPGWSAAVLVVFFVFSPVVALVVRRKWRLAEIRRMEVMRLVRLAAAETERAEKEAAAIIHVVEKPMSAVNGGVIGMSNCAVCHNPTTTRCSRCKAVKYCSGTCQITHWRQGHKYECHPPLIVDHYEGQPTVSDLKGAQTERPEISGNGLGIEGKGLVSNDGFNISQSVSNIVAAQSESSILIDRRSDIEVKPSDTKGQPKVSDLKGVEDELPEISGNGLGIEGKGHVTIDGFYVDKSFSNVVEAQSEPSVLVFSRSDIEAKPNDTKRVETFSTAPMPSSCPDRHKTSVIDAVLTSPYATNIAESSRISENAKEFSTLGSVSINHDKSKTSKSSVSDCEGRGETPDLTAAETITRADSTESQSCCNIHLQLDSGLHSAAANPGRSDFRETVSLAVGNSGQVAKESNNEQLASSSPNCPKDHLASVGHSKSFLGNGSLKENTPVSDKSIKVDRSVTNGNASSRKAVQPITPSSSLSRHGQSGHGKYNYKMLFPYDNFIRLYNSDKVAMHPCGLVNCGNSCYANVVLQCLAFTRPLAAFFLEGFHAKACPKMGWCFACEFETLLMKVKQGKSPFSPNGIISHIHDIGSNFGHGREEDAHEFLRYSIDALQSACLKEIGTKNVSELAEETTLIQLIFGGYLRSKIKCMRCQGKSERRERMMDLTIDVHGEIGTLEEALARFTASEILDGENKYKCGRCQSFERAKKQLTILEAPNVLTIALKRYQSGKYGKLNRMVRFSEYLNLAPYMRGSDDNLPVYRLYAVVVHSGHANATFSGHYVCYVKNTQGKWFKTDDSVVNQVDLQKVLSQGAYMLLYARCSPRAPILLRREMARKSKSKELGDVLNSAARSSAMFPHHHRAHAGRSTDDPSPHDLFGERLRRPPKADSSSDVSSLFSCSDEGSSWSTESTKDSAASDDFTDYSLSPRRVSVSSDASSLDFKDGDGVGEGRESLRFLYSVKDYRNLTEQVSSRSNAGADADWVNASEPKPNVLFRRTGGDRAAQTFY